MRLTALFATLLMASAAQAGDIPKLTNFRAGPTAGPAMWKTTYTMPGGAMQGQKSSETNCIDPANTKAQMEKMQKNNPAMNDCTHTVSKDTPTEAELIQKCAFQGMDTTITTHMQRVDDTHYSVDITHLIANVQTTIHVDGEYVGPCVK